MIYPVSVSAAFRTQETVMHWLFTTVNSADASQDSKPLLKMVRACLKPYANSINATQDSFQHCSWFLKSFKPERGNRIRNQQDYKSTYQSKLRLKQVFVPREKMSDNF